MNPLARVTIHHEGAGAPTDVARGAGGGYTYWLGVAGWQRLRSPYVSFATLHFNHVSVDVCLSGNRMQYPVTDHDLVLLAEIAADAKGRGELVAAPDVFPHRQSFTTACPGDLTMQRWADVAAQFAGSPAPAPAPAPTPEVLNVKQLRPDAPLTAAQQPKFAGKQPCVVAVEGSPIAWLVSSDSVAKYGGVAAFTPVAAAEFARFDIREG